MRLAAFLQLLIGNKKLYHLVEAVNRDGASARSAPKSRQKFLP